MKKILSILAASLFMFSCNHLDFYESPEQLIVDNYNSKFVSTFGEPSKTQTWGFGNTTRATYPNSNMWEDDGYVIPADITEDEIQKVLAVFNQKGEETYESLVDWDCFFVQQVWKGTAEHTAGNGGTVVGSNQMDWLCAYDPIGHEETTEVWWPEHIIETIINHDDHVYNFNNASGSIQLMVNSSTQRFGYHSSTDSKVHYYFRMEEIDGAYYVGFDFSAEGENPNQQVKRDFIYNDWIVKIVPGKGVSNNEINYIGMIIGEDLSVQFNSDWDFNDVVFAVGYKNDETYVKILAAGGQLPLYIEGIEIHEALGVNVTDMVNTGLMEVEPVELKISDTKLTPAEIKVAVYKQDNLIELMAPQGEPAAKIFIPDMKYKWCDERKDIRTVYPKFKTWVNTNTPEIWWN